jgi:aspartyl-tRNA(Asn)/glutamyl-tRNA(Gln) amidotransferase subunit B
MKSGYEAVIGLEVHVQLLTRSKMFCACANAYGGEPNSRTCPVCLGLPGALPVLNDQAVKMALALGHAVQARIQPRSVFYRKQYFYPDLPKGYQITQGPVAIVEEGQVEIPGDPRVRGAEGSIRARIERAHLEEDSGKSSHERQAEASLVDLNRAGVPLLEIVGAPDLRSGQEAYDYLKTLHHLVTFLGICDGSMEEGSLRCDANVSVRKAGDTAFGTRVEVKNINSFRFVKQALEYEIERQIACLEAGETLLPETRGWDAESGQTRSQRSKESATDYRYFPEPDLPTLTVSAEEIAAVRAALPELPEARRARLKAAHGLTDYEAGMLLQDRDFADYFEQVATLSGHGKQACNWMLGELSRILNERTTRIGRLSLSPEALAEMIRLVEGGTISHHAAKEIVFPGLLQGEGSAAQLVEKHGLAQVSDRSAIVKALEEVIAASAGPWSELKGGNERLKGFFVGQVMKRGKGSFNPKVVNEVIDESISTS